MDQLLSQLVLGIVSGALLVLLALGLNLIFGLLEFINFSHGALYMVGAYITSYLAAATGNIWLALLVVPVAMALIGAGLERTPEDLETLLDDNHPLARLVATCALAREESRGAHRRTDVPDPASFLELTHTVLGRGKKVTLTRWA